jgi:hypothetical protein
VSQRRSLRWRASSGRLHGWGRVGTASSSAVEGLERPVGCRGSGAERVNTAFSRGVQWGGGEGKTRCTLLGLGVGVACGGLEWSRCSGQSSLQQRGG